MGEYVLTVLSCQMAPCERVIIRKHAMAECHVHNMVKTELGCGEVQLDTRHKCCKNILNNSK